VKKRITQENLWQTWAGAVVLVCVLAGFVAVLVVSHQTDQRFRRFSEYLYKRCMAREVFDQAQTDARKAMIRDLDQRIAQEQTNRFIDDRLREQRIHTAQATKVALEQAVNTQLSPGCKPYLR
jgi:NADH:ubiquinone oxidoreductase subunit 5 (subunit L)/multisubunit Na+/H+ antiporter MnhA subunit